MSEQSKPLGMEAGDAPIDKATLAARREEMRRRVIAVMPKKETAMTEPKMLTAEELGDFAACVGRHLHHANRGYPLFSAFDCGRLLSHIAAQDAAIAAKDAEIAKLRAAVMAGDRLLIFAESGQDGDVCNICCARTDGPHVEDCDVPAYRTARAAVKLEGDDAKG